MGKPRAHIPVKLIVGLLSSEVASLSAARRALEKKFGKVDKTSGLMDFSSTPYYADELGQGIKRQFLSFEKPVSLRKNYTLKIYTNKLEYKFSRDEKRFVNIDPGYVSLTKLMLFTTKNRSHRIYLDSGIYADLELVFAKKSFRALEWTYPDYRTKEYIDFFNAVRGKYVQQIQKYLNQ